MKIFWNDRYKETDFAYGVQPNVFFREQLSAISKIGSLLLPMEGEGRNAVFAASLGWHVTAFDFSDVAQLKANELAKSHNVSIDFHVAEAQEFEYGIEQFDAIALVFAHLPETIRKVVHHKIIRALKPGGVLIVDSFHPNQLQHPSGGPRDVSMLYTLDMLFDDFKELTPMFTSEKITILDEGKYHFGSAFVTRLVAMKYVF
ncbi:MAG: class I SAM-dependent methyltransferase [Schleiferiaceae bacterium]|nr:class I SAM-dependent methyltransferase [Schleiferiaceae bacterium]